MAAHGKAEPGKNKGGRPPGRLNDRTLLLREVVARHRRLKPAAILDLLFDLAKAGDGHCATYLADLVGLGALRKQPLPEPQRHVVSFEYEDPLEVPEDLEPRAPSRKRARRSDA